MILGHQDDLISFKLIKFGFALNHASYVNTWRMVNFPVFALLISMVTLDPWDGIERP